MYNTAHCQCVELINVLESIACYSKLQERWVPVLYWRSWRLQHAARAFHQGLFKAPSVPHGQQQTKATPQ